ncbi:hypothetical protein KIPB_011224, partial [Kipferlia bialata]|eukprot:g11224.t1
MVGDLTRGHPAKRTRLQRERERETGGEREEERGSAPVQERERERARVVVKKEKKSPVRSSSRNSEGRSRVVHRTTAGYRWNGHRWINYRSGDSKSEDEMDAMMIAQGISPSVLRYTPVKDTKADRHEETHRQRPKRGKYVRERERERETHRESRSPRLAHKKLLSRSSYGESPVPRFPQKRPASRPSVPKTLVPIGLSHLHHGLTDPVSLLVCEKCL